MKVIELHLNVWNSLRSRREKLPHALLLIGQKGLGKHELANTFAASLLCEQPRADGLACGHCLACNWYGQGNHPDFRLLQPEAMSDTEVSDDGKKKPSRQITIDQIRALDDFFVVGTHRGGLRIVLVDPTEAMNRNAANSLLKTLEEPPAGTLFLLVSNEPMKLLPTIRSRCQAVPVPVPAKALSERFLADEGVPDAQRWLALAGGAPRLALEMARGGEGDWLEQLLKQLGAGKQIDPMGAALALEKAIKDSKGKLLLKQVVDALQKWVVDLTLASAGIPVRYFLPQSAMLGALAGKIPDARLIRAYRELIGRRQEAEQPLNARLALEGLFLDYRALFA